MLIEKHVVPKLNKPIRLQEYGVGIFVTKPTKAGFKKAIKKGIVFVNNTIGTTALYIHGGETIELHQNEDPRKKFNLQLNILFEDDYLAIIKKPAGIKVSGNSFATIDNALSSNLSLSTQPDRTIPRPVHRLDYPTSGLLLIGKTASSIVALNKLFENKEIQKTYHAITYGKSPKKGFIDIDIDDKNAYSEYKVLDTVVSARFEYLNLVKLSPKTGRKHQLRKHLLHIGTPILGDRAYFAKDKILTGKGLYLQATQLKFKHPFTEEIINIKDFLDKKFKKIFDNYAVSVNASGSSAK